MIIAKVNIIDCEGHFEAGNTMARDRKILQHSMWRFLIGLVQQL